VRDPGQVGGQQPADQQPEPRVIDVEQRPERVEAPPADGLGQRGGQGCAPEDDRRVAGDVPPGRGDPDRGGLRRGPVDVQGAVAGGDSQVHRHGVGPQSVTLDDVEHVGQGDGRRGAAALVEVGRGKLLAQPVPRPAQRDRDAGVGLDDSVGLSVAAADHVALLTGQGHELGR